MAGSSIVVKCSEWTAWSTQFWQGIIRQALVAEGLDENLVSFINGYPETGEALIDAVDKVGLSFVLFLFYIYSL